MSFGKDEDDNHKNCTLTISELYIVPNNRFRIKSQLIILNFTKKGKKVTTNYAH